MCRRRNMLAVLVVLLVASTAATTPSAQSDKKQREARAKQLQSMIAAVDAAVAGGDAPNDLGMSWVREDYLKAQGRQSYVVFTVALDPSKVSANQAKNAGRPGKSVEIYWRVLPAGKHTNDKTKPPYEDENDAAIPLESGNPVRISRSFNVAGGSYDVYVLAKDLSTPKPRVAVIKHEVTVPDFWSGELATSSLIVVDRIDPVPAPLSQEQKADRPYALGSFELIPSYKATFAKNAELSTFMQIYNAATDRSERPDVQVDCTFYAKQAGAPDKFFIKTQPQSLNAQTLPPEFSFAAGHQLQTGQAVLLSSFPEGDYRLEIKVTDRIANKTQTRDLNFTVGPS
jgi:hypothetical protein